MRDIVALRLEIDRSQPPSQFLKFLERAHQTAATFYAQCTAVVERPYVMLCGILPVPIAIREEKAVQQKRGGGEGGTNR
jgi:hypothetical protein